MSSPISQELFINLIKKQKNNIPNVGNYSKLTFDDIKRLDKYIKGNIFNSYACCIYKGELKKAYATISFKGKKVSVHRLLYHNYIDNITKDDYVYFSCYNKGACCNLNHFKILKNKKKPNINKNDEIDDDKKDDKLNMDINNNFDMDDNIFQIEFD